MKVFNPRAVWRDYDESVVQAVLTTDGNRAITATVDGVAYVHYVNGTGQASTRFSPHGRGLGLHGMINGAAISADGCTAATAGMDGKVCVWDTATAVQLAAFRTPDATSAADVALAQESQIIAAAFVHPAEYDALPKATVAIFELSEDHNSTAARCRAQWSTTISRRLRLEISKDGSMVAHTCARGVAVVDAVEKTKVGEWPTKGDAAISLNPQATSIAIADSYSLRIASLSEKKVKFFKPYVTPLEPAVAFGAQGKRVAAAFKGGIIRVWSALTGAPLADLKGAADDITAISMSENGRFILGSSFDKRTYLWELPPVNSLVPIPAPSLSMVRRNVARKSFYTQIEIIGRDQNLLHIQAKNVLKNLLSESDLKYLPKYSIAEILSERGYRKRNYRGEETHVRRNTQGRILEGRRSPRNGRHRPHRSSYSR